MQESGLTEIIPSISTSAVWGQYPVLSHPESPQGASLWGDCSDWGLDGGRPVSILSSLRAHHQETVMWWLKGCYILCLLIWQAAFLVHIIENTHPTLQRGQIQCPLSSTRLPPLSTSSWQAFIQLLPSGRQSSGSGDTEMNTGQFSTLRHSLPDESIK